MCSSASPSMREPIVNSIGHASLPGCNTTAWPPNWNAPSSKLVRVRSDGLKNTSAIDCPLSSSPSRSCLYREASTSNASRSCRVQSWVLRKCFIGAACGDGGGCCAMTVAGKQKSPAGLGFFRLDCNVGERLPGADVGFRSARTRGHPCRHAGGGQDRHGGEGGGHRTR